MRRHGPVIAHCTDSEDFPYYASSIYEDDIFFYCTAYCSKKNVCSRSRQFGTSAELSERQYGTGAELSRHFGTGRMVEHLIAGKKSIELVGYVIGLVGLELVLRLAVSVRNTD